ncbi:hypothetical protein HK097_001286 [Rhizophlyctis rosea]|uniref:RRM domain-containing protein n=1 Tax=Rhizophlyctis rosea TaxID=64517 RepID=A0AAD5X869_9FUNG|nr:hypothetical protein HK097_001286 [Rhizophlyctis rosea]
MVDYSKNTVAKLKDIYKERGLSVGSRRLKADLITGLTEDDEKNAQTEAHASEDPAHSDAESSFAPEAPAVTQNLPRKSAEPESNNELAVDLNTAPESASIQNPDEQPVVPPTGAFETTEPYQPETIVTDEGNTLPEDVDQTEESRDSTKSSAAAANTEHGDGNFEQIEHSNKDEKQRENVSRESAQAEAGTIDTPMSENVPTNDMEFASDSKKRKAEDETATDSPHKRQRPEDDTSANDIVTEKGSAPSGAHAPKIDPTASVVEADGDVSMVLVDESQVQPTADESSEQRRDSDESKTEAYQDGATSGPTNTLVVIGFTRPLKLTDVEVLMSTYGQYTKLWMNKIKTHCFVTYTTSEEAAAAERGIAGKIFPEGTGRPLSVEFLSESEAELQMNSMKEREGTRDRRVLPPGLEPGFRISLAATRFDPPTLSGRPLSAGAPRAATAAAPQPQQPQLTIRGRSGSLMDNAAPHSATARPRTDPHANFLQTSCKPKIFYQYNMKSERVRRRFEAAQLAAKRA